MRPNHHFEALTFKAVRNQIKDRLIKEAHAVRTHTWQGSDISNRPEAEMYELLNVTLTVPLDRHRSLEAFQNDIEPNLPWADDHFKERVCGYPINPGVEWANWPWGSSAEKFLNENGQFNHNYMERLWPKFANSSDPPTQTVNEWLEANEGGHANKGIRGTYGDLDSVYQLLVKDPHTRQAWIPLFFPEDTGIGDGGRKPCTLGYQFILRGDSVHIYYPLRSCDFFAHMQDDIYMAVRLLMWMRDQVDVFHPNHPWATAKLGSFSMHCTSLHIFANDYYLIGGKPK